MSFSEPPPERPKKGPGAPIPIDIPMDTEEIKEIEADLNKGSYPGTDTLNDNANVSFTMNNNRDFYEKYRNVSKNIQLKNSDTDLIKFTKSQPLSSSVENENIPNLSALATTPDEIKVDEEPLEESDSNVPDLSALQHNSVAVPDLSSLLSNDDGSDSSSSSSSVNSENAESSVSSNITPNLNDSSLTTITETSGDNSFDISNGSFKSNENIPV